MSEHGLTDPKLTAFHHYLETGETPRSIARASEARRPINRVKAIMFSWTTVGVLLVLALICHAIAAVLNA